MLQHLRDRGPGFLSVGLQVQEVAPLAEPALAAAEESDALLGLVLAVVVVVLPELVRAMCELAAVAVGAAAFLYELLAELGLLLVLSGLRAVTVD